MFICVCEWVCSCMCVLFSGVCERELVCLYVDMCACKYAHVCEQICSPVWVDVEAKG